jgi:tetraacyldisaccharide 4'-kinase
MSWIFSAIIYVRKYLYIIGFFKSTRLGVPVIVVGNITVGGTGKTPMVIWLIEQLQKAGYKPGVISRGYGGTSKTSTAVFANSKPQQVGDEPVLIAKHSTCPIFVGANRVAAGQALLKANPFCNVIISDDGLQHYALERDVEIALINSSKQFGNRFLLPAGPLREKISRLQTVDAIVDSGYNVDFENSLKADLQSPMFKMQMQGEVFKSLNAPKVVQSASYFANSNLVAIAGIGDPQRFFNKLSSLGLQFEHYAFADHHAFTSQDLEQFQDKTILMTEKDAVKCSFISTTDAWYLPVTAMINDSNQVSLITLILKKLRNK